MSFLKYLNIKNVEAPFIRESRNTLQGIINAISTEKTPHVGSFQAVAALGADAQPPTAIILLIVFLLTKKVEVGWEWWVRWSESTSLRSSKGATPDIPTQI